MSLIEETDTGILYYNCDEPLCTNRIQRSIAEPSIQKSGWKAITHEGKWNHYCPQHAINNSNQQLRTYNTVPTNGPRQTFKVPFSNGNILNISDSESIPIQSEVFQAMYRLDPMVLLELGRVMMVGEKSHNDTGTPIGQENWRKISFKDHFNHAFIHLVKDFQEQVYGEEVGDDEAGEHLAHAMCRLMFAMAVRNMENAHVE